MVFYCTTNAPPPLRSNEISSKSTIPTQRYWMDLLGSHGSSALRECRAGSDCSRHRSCRNDHERNQSSLEASQRSARPEDPNYLFKKTVYEPAAPQALSHSWSLLVAFTGHFTSDPGHSTKRPAAEDQQGRCSDKQERSGDEM